MMFTNFSLALFAGATVFIYFYPSWVSFLMVNGVLLGLAVIDYLLLPRSRQVVAERQVEEVVQIDDYVDIIVLISVMQKKITGKPPKLKIIKVKDEIPEYTYAEPAEINKIIREQNTWRGEYRLKPLRRGDCSFGRLNIRILGPMGLIIRQYSITPPGGDIKVYPRMNILPRHELAALQASLTQAGLRPSRYTSIGTDFEALREYRQDDDIRRVNWKASARKGKPVSNEYQVEKSQNLMLVFEAGRMMRAEAFGSFPTPAFKEHTNMKQLTSSQMMDEKAGGRSPHINKEPITSFYNSGRSKLDYAIEAGLKLGFTAISAGDNLGSVSFADKVLNYLPPASNRGQVRKIAGAVYGLHPNRLEPHYRKAFTFLSSKLKKRSMFCVFTDLIDLRASAELVESIVAVGNKHLVLLVLMGDGYLQQLMRIESRDAGEVYRKAVAEQYLQERERGILFLRNRGVEVVEMLPETDPTLLISRYLEIKARLRL